MSKLTVSILVLIVAFVTVQCKLIDEVNLIGSQSNKAAESSADGLTGAVAGDGLIGSVNAIGVQEDQKADEKSGESKPEPKPEPAAPKPDLEAEAKSIAQPLVDLVGKILP